MTNPSSTTRSSMFIKVELSFIAWSSVLLSEIRAAGEGLYREVCDQLDRAVSPRCSTPLKVTANAGEAACQIFR